LGLNKASRLQPCPPAVYYEHSWPDKIHHLDIKKLGRIEVVGQRAHHLGSFQNQELGRLGEYLHACVTTTAA
jgi:hypothetical protein